MQFNVHKNLEGRHAILSASSWRWLNDDSDSLMRRLCGQYSTTIGTILHDIARKHIQYRVKMNKYDKKNVMLELLSRGIPYAIIETIDFDSKFDNLMAYTNDCIGFGMEPEVVLSYSNNFFGTTDAIKFNEANHLLRIHDYKSGDTLAHMEQLMIYAALFCLEYGIKPEHLSPDSELRIYQSGEVIYCNPTAEDIIPIMDKIVDLDKFLNQINEEA